MESSDTRNPSDQHQQPPLPKAIVCLHVSLDDQWYDELKIHLSLLKKKGFIQWLETSAGLHVEDTPLKFIQQADVILLLISADFFSSDIYYKAMAQALAEREKRGVPVVPILARYSPW